MKKINFVNKPNTDTPINATNLNKMQDYIEESFEAVDYTSQCTFMNCTLKGGAIYKIGKIVFVQVYITATVTHSWEEIVEIPDDLTPLVTSSNGSTVGGTEFWVYATNFIKGGIEKDKDYSIVGVYLAKN